jgi:tetratricopeptide (TPR) repeat protein
VELLSELIAGLDEADPEHRFTLGAAYGMRGFLLIRAQSGGAALEMAAKGQAMLRPYRLPTRNWALWMALEASVGAHWARGELDEGERYVRENLALARADRDNARSDIDLRVAEVFAGISLHVLGMFEIIRGHYAQAIPYLEESRDLLDKHSSITLSYTLWNLGQAEFHTGALASARATLERGLELSQALGYSTMRWPTSSPT